jgi:hypothetical protein
MVGRAVIATNGLPGQLEAFAARIVSVGLIGVSADSRADLDGGLAQKSKRLSDRLKQGSRPKEVLNCNALP